ncbi:MAG: hypothetical protein FWE40_10110 [Oscillospiraceae bacterium]|nr:hypothetical protein [Oscillospiraceae bacterium]
MAKKLLAIVLAAMFVFSFGLVASAADGGECLCPPEATCIEECECAETGRCVCPTEEDTSSNVWKIILGVVAGIVTIAVLFFGTRLMGCIIFC